MRVLTSLFLSISWLLFTGCAGENTRQNEPVYSTSYPNVSVISPDSLAAWLHHGYLNGPLLLESTTSEEPGQYHKIISVDANSEDLVFLENVAHDDPIVCFGAGGTDPGALCNRLVEAGYQNVALIDQALSAQQVARMQPSE